MFYSILQDLNALLQYHLLNFEYFLTIPHVVGRFGWKMMPFFAPIPSERFCKKFINFNTTNSIGYHHQL